MAKKITELTNATSITATGCIPFSDDFGTGLSTYGIPFESFMGNFLYDTLYINFLDQNTELTSGSNKFSFFIPDTLNSGCIVSVHCGVSTPSSSGSIVMTLYDDTNSGSVTNGDCGIQVNEYTSYTYEGYDTIPLNYGPLSTGDKFYITVEQAGTGARGSTMIIKVRKY